LALRQEEFTSLCDDVDLDRDRALVERCQAGDSAAFGNLYARYYERLLRFCLRRLNDRHEAEDAAQEAFARAWKALPQFAGERRFYPWLTVIAGNICTDMLRRRSRSTPTDDLELTAHQPVGGGASETSEELVLAAVDGEMVNRALDRLSARHRHVLAMREGSGWTYQQIADHEGVEIGTIETLLWRARQALKREFNVISESKGALGGFLIGAGALLRRGVLRAAHRVTVMQQSASSGSLRTAVAGAAVTGAAVAAGILAPQAFAPTHTNAAPSATTAAPANLADPALPLTSANDIPLAPVESAVGEASGASGSLAGVAGSAATGAGGAGGAGTSADGQSPLPVSGGTGGPGGVAGALTNAPNELSPLVTPVTSTLNGLTSALSPVTSALSPVTSALSPVTSALGTTTASTLSAVVNVLSSTTNTLASTLGLAEVLSQLPAASSSGIAGSTTSTTTAGVGALGSTVKSVTAPVNSTLKSLLGG